jgi:hypothetical protein
MKLRTAFVALLALSATPLTHADTGGWTNRPGWAAENEGERPAARRRPASVAGSSLRQMSAEIRPFTPGSHNLAIDLGQIFLLGSDYADSIGTQLHYTYGVSDMFAFDASLGHSSHSDGKYSQTALLAGMRTNLAWYDKVVPYLNFGMGFYKPSYKFAVAEGRSESASPTLFGVHLGPGVDLELTRSLFFGASLTFHDMFGTSKVVGAAGEQDLGGTYTSFFLRAGVTF